MYETNVGGDSYATEAFDAIEWGVKLPERRRRLERLRDLGTFMSVALDRPLSSAEAMILSLHRKWPAGMVIAQPHRRLPRLGRLKS